MVDELQVTVRETSSLVSTSDMEVGEPNVPITMQDDADLTGEAYYPQDTEVNELAHEVFAAVKDDRMNTKKAISAVIASTTKVQNQNDRVIGACERELRRRNLTEERRMEYYIICLGQQNRQLLSVKQTENSSKNSLSTRTSSHLNC